MNLKPIIGTFLSLIFFSCAPNIEGDYVDGYDSFSLRIYESNHSGVYYGKLNQINGTVAEGYGYKRGHVLYKYIKHENDNRFKVIEVLPSGKQKNKYMIVSDSTIKIGGTNSWDEMTWYKR
ncbi:hypothetical protein [Flammeovirga agarivorans]|uniref:Uncharacterized protein n=1 Tax=Flammeovirga agarivorans TaxID=2726742 RepID=A0A7X8SKA7_9BACT|nr:hypothetical protein [Flammeovirga agarivorans]NLR91735.1 hypothetical protein [Flammeovirga agarivorans]